MKMKYIFILLVALFLSSCFGDLNTSPLDDDLVTSGIVYDDPNSYLGVLAKLYAGLAVSGQEGPAGQSDISGLDEGFGQYLRGYFYHQEFTTEEALVGWNDQTIKDFHAQTWSASDAFIYAHYSRILYQITLCNEFIRQTEPNVLDERGVESDLKADIELYRSEARFLRALSYWHALDLFRNVPFVTEDDPVGSFFPKQASPQDLFNYIESELKEIENTITPARMNEYGRADQAAVQVLLAKLYLNAKVYIDQEKYQEALDYCKKVIDAGYTLDPSYPNLFLADNHTSPEIIFPVNFDGNNTRTWGGMTFIIRAAIGGDMPADESGVINGWGGVRTTRQLVEKFPPGGGVYIASNEGQTGSYPKIYIPNSTQNFDATDTDFSLTSMLADKVYEGHVYFPDDGGEFFITKFPGSNPQILGDSDGDGILEVNGDNIKLGEAGLYYVRVDLNDDSYEFERREWSLIGDATPNGNSVDTEMEYDPELNAFYVQLDLSAGGLKFRSNGSWDVHLGDAEQDGLLEYDGGDIIIDEAESYTIYLYMDKPDYTYQIDLNSFDRRAIFYSEGHNLDIEDVVEFTEGYAVTKFKNVTSDGLPGSNLDFPDTDFPMFRLGDVYLMAAESILRGANGSQEEALGYFNALRERAYSTTSGNITADALDLDVILDERAKELYWECHRRTDLVRFGQFTDGDYLWQWKGNVMEGAKTEPFRNIFPIPSNDLAANPGLQQNPGY